MSPATTPRTRIASSIRGSSWRCSSQDTQRHDRGAKFEDYRSVDIFEEYVLVWQDRVRVEVRRREGERRWAIEEFEAGEAVPLRSVDAELDVDALYAGVFELKGDSDPRTIRFPNALRERVAADAERCGRSFEGQVLALLRRHYGEDVDIAPLPDEVLGLVQGSLEGLTADGRALPRKLTEDD